jgi:sentrin-specific protease 1
MRLKRVEFYDSLGGRRDLVFRVSDPSPSDHASSLARHAALSRFRLTIQRLREYLDLEHRDKKLKPFDFEGWEDYHSEVRFTLLIIEASKGQYD